MEELGVVKRTLTRWLQAGLPHEINEHGRRRYNMDEVRQWMQENSRTGIKGRVVGMIQGPGGVSLEGDNPEFTGDIREDLLRAKLRKEIAQASKHELDVMQRRGELLEKAEVERGRLDRVARARAVLLGGPATLAADLEGLDLERRERRIKEWVIEALEELSRE